MVEGSGTGDPGNGVKFTEWLKHYEQDRQEIRGSITAQNRNLNQLTKDVAALTSTVAQLAENQRGLFRRHDRPFQWGAFVSAIVGAGVFAGLLIAPINAELNRGHEFDNKLADSHMEYVAASAALMERTKWLERMEAREALHHEAECVE